MVEKYIDSKSLSLYNRIQEGMEGLAKKLFAGVLDNQVNALAQFAKPLT